MFPILQVGPVALQVPGLALLLGVWVGLNLAEKEAARHGQVSAEALYNLALTAIVAGLLGARLAYVLRYWPAYLADPLGVVSLSPATLDAAAGLLIGAVAAVIYGARKQLPAWPTLDALAPGLAVMGAAIGLAHLASGDAFGAPTTVPWRVFLWGEYRHPSQVYEVLGALGVLAAWWWAARRASVPAGSGRLFVLVAAGTAAARVFLEAFRGDSVLIASGLRAAQVWGWLVLAVCLWLWPRLGPRPAADEQPLE